jgi:hypothetical protein
MTPRERLDLTLAVLVASSPLAISVILLVRRAQYMRLRLWRYRLATGGLALAVIAAIPAPAFYFALELPETMHGPKMLAVVNWSLPVGLATGLMAMVLLVFGEGRVRWIGIGSCLLSLAMLYVTLLGLSD